MVYFYWERCKILKHAFVSKQYSANCMICINLSLSHSRTHTHSPLSPDQDQASPLNIDSIEVSVGGADSSDEENNTSSDSDEERYNNNIMWHAVEITGSLPYHKI